MKHWLRNTSAALALIAGAGVMTAPVHADDEVKPLANDIDPFAGDIDPFHGDINPFHGDIDPFYGDINPFWGDINPFWGDINPFSGDINPFHGDIDPFWGDINPFHGDINPFWGDIDPFWSSAGPAWGDINAFWKQLGGYDANTAADYSRLAQQVQDLISRARAVFDPMAEHQGVSGGASQLIERLLAQYGIDPNDPASLEAVDGRMRSMFFLDLYDGLMAFSGTDRVDHWMATANWSPALSQAAKFGHGARIGVVDFGFVEGNAFNDVDAQVHVRSGRGAVNSGHGAAVLGLLAGAHNGEGVMGIAPEAHYTLYNPFDATNTTNWQTVGEAIARLLRGNVDVINLSLGVSGYTLHQHWGELLSDKHLARAGDRTLFVIAAGNDGITQTSDIVFRHAGLIDNLLVVGSVGPSGAISSFSNRPGEACLTVRRRCSEGNRLMDRFLVAPGELLFVPDGQGGYHRLSGTSFAAPLVSGAAALIHSQWGWLYGEDMAEILLESATDLGDPGTDAVYGRGLLNIHAAMSPLDRDNLFHIRPDGSIVMVRDMNIVPGQLSFATPTENAIVVFERTKNSIRDFMIEVSTEGSRGGDVYLGERIYLWEADSSESDGGSTALRDGSSCGSSSACLAFGDTGAMAFDLSGRGHVQARLIASRQDPHEQLLDGELPFQVGLEITDTTTGREVRFGVGEGAMALSQQRGFGFFSDHRSETGGVNPVLGLASGGVYAMTGMALGEQTRLSLGVTQTQERLRYANPFTGEQHDVFASMPDHAAQAIDLGLRHALTQDVSVQASYSLLNEEDSLLGARGSGEIGFRGGAMTDAVTLGAEADLGVAFLSASATLSRTRATGFDGQMLSLSDDVLSSAYQISAQRAGILGSQDALRVSIIQPLHVEQGHIDYTATQVVDRETGELGVVTDRWELGGMRPTYAEVLYATPLSAGDASLSLFTRFELSGEALSEERVGVMSGARYTLRF